MVAAKCPEGGAGFTHQAMTTRVAGVGRKSQRDSAAETPARVRLLHEHPEAHDHDGDEVPPLRTGKEPCGGILQDLCIQVVQVKADEDEAAAAIRRKLPASLRMCARQRLPHNPVGVVRRQRGRRALQGLATFQNWVGPTRSSSSDAWQWARV